MAQTMMQIVQELLAKGADVNWVEEKTGVTPLMVASSEGFGETAAVLAAHESLVRAFIYTLSRLSTLRPAAPFVAPPTLRGRSILLWSSHCCNAQRRWRVHDGGSKPPVAGGSP